MEKKDDFPLKNIFFPLTSQKIFLFLLIIGIVVFSPTFFNGFVADDFFLVVNNPMVHSLNNIPTLFYGPLGNQGGQFAGLYYRPFMLAYFSFTHLFFGSYAFLYHSLQLIICIINAFLVYKLFQYFFTKTFAFLLSALFLIHPINTETVAWISGTNDMLFLFFGLLAIIRMLSASQNKVQFFTVGSLLCASYLSKETGLLFIPIIILFTFLYRKTQLQSYFFVCLFSLIPYLFFRLALGQVGFTVFPPNLLSQLSIFERMLQVPAITFYYIQNAFIPLFLVMPHGWIINKITFSDFWIPLLYILLFFICAAYMGFILFKKRSKQFQVYSYFLIWFVIGTGFHLHIIPLDYTASDRWFYFPLIGLLGAIGSFLYEYKKMIEQYKYFPLILLSIFLFFSITSWIRTSNWNNGLSLWSRDIFTSRPNTELENALGFALLENGNYKQAEKHLLRSIELFPNSSNLTNLGVVYIRMGKHRKGIETLKKAVSFGNYYLAYQNLALQYYQQKEYTEAITFSKKALEKFPTSSLLWLVLGVSEYESKNYFAALTAIKNSYSLEPNDLNTALYKELLKLTNTQKIPDQNEY